MGVVKISPLAPAVGRIQAAVAGLVRGRRQVSRQRIPHPVDRLVPHALRKRAVEQVELAVVVVAAERPALRRTVEAAVAQHELLVPVHAAVVPDRGLGLGVHLVDRAIRHIAPPVRADEIHRPGNAEPRVVIAAIVPPEGKRVRPLAQDVRILEHRAIAPAEDRDRVGADDPVGIPDRQVLQQTVVAVNVHHRGAEVVPLGLIFGRPLVEFDPGPGPALAPQRDAGGIDPDLFIVDPILDEDDRPHVAGDGDGLDGLLDRGEVAGAVGGDDEVVAAPAGSGGGSAPTGAGPGRADAPGAWGLSGISGEGTGPARKLKRRQPAPRRDRRGYSAAWGWAEDPPSPPEGLPARAGDSGQKAPTFLSEDRGINLAMTYSRGTLRPTTIGCSGLNGRVRDGNGWDPRQMITRKGYRGGSRGARARPSKSENV